MFGVNVFKTLTRLSEVSPAAFTIENNPYKAQKVWPPDFTKLSPKYQLRFERRYRRRTKLKGTKPSWNRNLGLFAAGTSFGFIVYTILFMDLGTGEERNPFAGDAHDSVDSEVDVRPEGFNVDAERSANPGGYRGHKSARDGDTWL